MENNKSIFITGATGYVGSRIIPLLLAKGYSVNALVRKGSETKLPPECKIIFGNALDRETFRNKIAPSETFIQLVGVAHPGPGKKKQFNEIDLKSVTESVSAAKDAGIKHFIYMSVAYPAPIMHDYIEVRNQGEELIRQSGMNATFLKPWYVLGPGHYWPYIMLPFYKVFEIIPWTRDGAKRLGLVTIKNMVNSIVYAVENPPTGIRIITAEQIKKI